MLWSGGRGFEDGGGEGGALRLQRVRVRGRGLRGGGRWARGVGVLAGVLGAARAQYVRGRQPSEGAAAWGEAGVVVERRAGL